MFNRPRPSPPVQAPQPVRTFLTLHNDAARSVDLWGLARRIEQRIREMGGPEALPQRAPQHHLDNPVRYTWSWSGDQREILALAAEVVIEERQLPVSFALALDGVPPAPVAPAPEPEPAEPEPAAEPEPDPVEEFEEARGELHAALAGRRLHVRIRPPGAR